MILLIDNYDSFTYNLYQQISKLNQVVKVVRNDAITIKEIRNLKPKAIVLSPGPGTPSEAGISVEVVRELYKEIPILGICLGHQSIGEAFGCKIERAKNIMHGKLSILDYKKCGLFESLEGEIEVMRYHSLVIEPSNLSADLEVMAISRDDREIMGIQHRSFPVFGLQFHPESIGTVAGTRMIESFLKQIDLLKV